MTYSMLRTIFERVRDDPFRIPTGIGEVINTCYGKNLYLCRQLEPLGYKTRLRVATTSWTSIFDYLAERDSSIAPMLDNLRRLPHMDDSFHVYAEILVDGKWMKADTTFDRQLAPTFPLTQWYDSEGSELAVPVVETFSPEISQAMLSDKEAMKSFENELLTNTAFYNGINNLAQQIRFRRDE